MPPSIAPGSAQRRSSQSRKAAAARVGLEVVEGFRRAEGQPVACGGRDDLTT